MCIRDRRKRMASSYVISLLCMVANMFIKLFSLLHIRTMFFQVGARVSPSVYVGSYKKDLVWFAGSKQSALYTSALLSSHIRFRGCTIFLVLLLSQFISWLCFCLFGGTRLCNPCFDKCDTTCRQCQKKLELGELYWGTGQPRKQQKSCSKAVRHVSNSNLRSPKP
eukprot:4039465-Amphidinium_carterae.1